MLSGLDLFSGIGGISFALRKWVRPIAYCESDRYCQSVLLSRMRSGDIASAPINDDVRNLNGRMFQYSRPEIIYGGFPCQDISVAGLGTGLGGEQSGLFNHIARLVSETNPQFVFLENVPAIRTRGLNCIVQTFTELGYDCRWTIVSAAEVGAVHIRKRWFLLAHTNSFRLRQEQWKELEGPRKIKGQVESDSKSSPRETSLPCPGEIKSTMVGDGNGLQFIVDRNRAIGNSVVPKQAKVAFERLIGKSL